MLRRLVKQGSVSNVEKSLRTKGGAPVPVLLSGGVMRNDEGEIRGIVCLALDITERKRAEETLRESEARLRSLIETLPRPSSCRAGRFAYLNPAASKLFGVSRLEDLLGKDFAERMAPEHRDAIRERIRLQSETGKPSPLMEQEYLRLDGSRVPVETTAVSIRYQGEDLPPGFHPRHHRTQAGGGGAAGERELYRFSFENLLNGFAYRRMLFDDGKPQDFIYLAVNDAFESQTGLKDVVGKKVTEVIPGIREADPQLFEIYGRVATTGQPERFEMFVKALKMWFLISVYSPAPEHFAVVFDAITDRKRAEIALRESEERLRLAAQAANFGHVQP